jgi:hypothetical protein
MTDDRPDHMGTRLDYEDVVWSGDLADEVDLLGDGERAIWKGYQGHITMPVLGPKYAWSVITLPDRELVACGSANWRGNCRVDAVSAMFKHWRRVHEKPEGRP